MPIFDRYIAVDWSANNGPKTGRDSIWIAEATPAGLVASRNPATRTDAMADLERTLLAARARGERVLCGFDFAFGFPRGTAERVGQAVSPAHQPWQSLWSTLFALIEDSDGNLSNRFEVADALNQAGAKFWGHPHGRHYAQLTPRKPADFYRDLPERRAVEAELRGPQPVWKLTGVGAVGSQTLLGIARLEALRRHPVLGRDVAIWPFETDFERRLAAPIVVAEIYPSLLGLTSSAEPRDRAQVETCVTHYGGLDAAGLLATFLAAPRHQDAATRAACLAEEGWIAGVGQPALCRTIGVAA